MSANSTRQPRSRKAAGNWSVAGFVLKKPYPDFPLSPHASGAWQKKIRGKLHYFGKWARRVNGKLTLIEGDGWWKDALELYKVHADGRHRIKTDDLTVADLCNRFLTAKQRQYEAGEISARMYKPGPKPELATGEYKATTDRLVSAFGGSRLVDDLAADDFEALREAMAKQWGPTRLGNEIQRVRTVFKYGFEAGLIEKPIRYGPQFKKPSASVMRRHRAKKGERMLEAADLRNLIDAANVPVKAMILLGVNCGFGNHDVATLPESALDLDRGWINYARPKTGIDRRCPLWPETVAALRAAIAERPEPQGDDAQGLAFVTTRGRPWLVNGIANPVSVATRDLLKKVKIHREGIGFYTLRHVFRTIADGSLDQVAVNHIMGHADATIAATYRERIDDDRLRAVAEHVRAWLWPKVDKVGADDETASVAPAEPKPISGKAYRERPTLRLFAG